ncbi:hypothetical protein [Coleofasciculus chthonoplastes]|uniref:hypothetical protein n=1 Tax=Coleofasciculus chthonoplastes TaxID=64178 RepID=UPI0032FDDE66
MSQRRVQIVILCEDRQQEVFARHFLKKRGFNGIFRAKICPPGRQSGEQYVRTQYPVEVKTYRQNRNRVSRLVEINPTILSYVNTPPTLTNDE